jgi:hypothetical protein
MPREAVMAVVDALADSIHQATGYRPDHDAQRRAFH